MRLPLSSGVFWGLLLIILGVLAIVRTVFNIHLPLFRIAVALFFIYLGLSILLGGFGIAANRNMVLFQERRIVAAGETDEYLVLFGTGTVDLTKLPVEGTPELEVTTVFGGSRIVLDKDVPARVTVTSAFGSASRPGSDSMAFGEFTYTTDAYRPGEKHLRVEANVVFGSLRIDVR